MDKKFMLKRKRIMLENRLHRLQIDKILAKDLKEEHEIQNQIDQVQFELSNIAFEEI
jgi:hypothetical protein